MGPYGGRLCAALLTVACIQGAGATTTPAQVQSTSVPRGTVLVLIPVQPGRPLFDQFARGVAAEFVQRPSLNVVLSFEQLYGVTDSEAVAQQQIEFVKAKYNAQPIAAIIALGHPRYLQIRERLGVSPDVPLIFMAEHAVQYTRPDNAVFIDIAETLVDSWAYMRPLFAAHHPVAILGEVRRRIAACLAAPSRRFDSPLATRASSTSRTSVSRRCRTGLPPSLAMRSSCSTAR